MTIRREAKLRVSMALGIAQRLTADPKLAKKVARRLLALPGAALTTRQLVALSRRTF
jgi:hypothetical protein